MIIDEADAQWLSRTHGVLFFPRIGEPTTVLGENQTFETPCQHRPGAMMPLGAYSYSRSFCPDIATVGRYCSIGAGLAVMGEAHPTDWISSSPVFYRPRRAGTWGSTRKEFPAFGRGRVKPEIGHDVWIGDDVLLAHGIRIGTGAVIAARSVVTRDVPPYAIVAGSPARVRKMRFDDTTIERLLASTWWEWTVNTWDDCDPQDIEAFIDRAAEIAETLPKKPEEGTSIKSLLAARRGSEV